MEELEIQGKKYISSKRASKITGYAKDYIGQLARAGKIAATRVGRAWYVSEAEILKHAGIGDVEEGSAAISEGETMPRKEQLLSLNEIKSRLPVPAPKLLKTWSEVTYHYDESPLIPEKITAVEAPKTIRIIKTATPIVKEEVASRVPETTPVSVVAVHKNKSVSVAPVAAIDGMTLSTGHKVSAPPARTKRRPVVSRDTQRPVRPVQHSRSQFPVVYTLAITGSALTLLFIILSGNVVTMEWGVGTQTASAATTISGPETLLEYFTGIFITALDLLKEFFSIIFGSFWSFVEDGINFILSVFS